MTQLIEPVAGLACERGPVFFWLDCMTDIDTINSAIVDAATGPAEVEVGDERVKARSVDELIKAANHIAAQASVDNGTFGLRTLTLKGGGAW